MKRLTALLGGIVVVLTIAIGRPACAVENQSDAQTAASEPQVSKATKGAKAESTAKKPKKDKTKKADRKPKAETKPKAAEEAKVVKDVEPAAKPEKTAQAAAKPEAQQKADQKKPEKPPTYTVVREPFKVELSLKGIFEAVDATAISLRPKQWKELTVVEAVEHGDKVRKGDVLVRLDLEKLDEQIADLRKDLELADLGLKQGEENLQVLKESTPLDLEIAQRAKRVADEDFERFLKVDRPMYRKVTDFMLKMTQQNLDYQKEELRQLEKMYKADDLTEETEEIVLKRQRNAVQQAEFYLEMAKVRHEESLQLGLPRMEESEKYASRQQDLQTRKAQITLPVTLKQQHVELAKRKVDRQRLQKRLNELKADRAAMTIKAPVDGIVYYGQYTRGQWIGASSAADDLRPNGTLSRDKVFMTIVQDRPMKIRAEVPEESLHYVHPGLKGTVGSVSYPDLKLKASVESVDAMPFGNQYAATIEPSLPHEAKMLVPGMTCTVKFVPYLKKRALVVPAAAVFTDKIDSEKKYVLIYQEGEKPQKQPVTVGQKSADRLEILDGLDRGDEILLEEPKGPQVTKLKDE